jgi:signal transduction histidine kinase/CheY-like chemotaxis protein
MVFAICLFLAYVAVGTLFVWHPRLSWLSVDRPEQAEDATVEWTARDGLRCDRTARLCCRILPYCSVSFGCDFTGSDDHILDVLMFGSGKFTPYTVYDEGNSPTVFVPVKLVDSQLITFSVSVRKGEDLRPFWASMDALQEYTRLFLHSLMGRTRWPEMSWEVMRQYVRFTCELWDSCLVSFFLERHDNFQLLVSYDRTEGACRITDEMLRQAEPSPLLRSPRTVFVGEFRLFLIRTVFGELTFVTVIGDYANQSGVAAITDFANRFLVFLLSLSYALILQEEQERTFKGCLAMMRSTHSFSVAEFRGPGSQPFQRFGQLSTDPDEIELLCPVCYDYLSLKKRSELNRAIVLLREKGVGFFQVPYEILLPRGNRFWYSLSADSSYDAYYDEAVRCWLFEDVSNLHQLNSQLRQTLDDMAVASHLLQIENFERIPHGRLEVELAQGGHTICVVHPDDFAMFDSIEESSLIKVRLSSTELEQPDWKWFCLVCTTVANGVRGFVFSLQEQMELLSEIEATRDCFRMASESQRFGVRAIMTTSKRQSDSLFEPISVDDFLNCVDPEMSNQITREDLMSLNQIREMELRLKLPDSTTWEWYSMTLLPAAPNEILLLVFECSERKRTSDLLMQTQELLSLALTYGDVRIWYFDDSVGDNVSGRTFSEDDDLLVLNWSMLQYNVAAEYQESVAQEFRAALREAKGIEIEVPVFFDSLHWLLLRGMVVSEENSTRLLGVYFDLTDIKEASNEMAHQKMVAEEALLAKSTFLANMSHEIRTPLNGIRGLLDILQTSDMTSEDAELVRYIQMSFVELLELLNDTLDLAKLESYKLPPLSLCFNPVESIINQESLFERRTATLIYQLIAKPETPVTYYGDPYCFARILTNLISNAAKFTPSGTITITLSCRDDEALVVSVADTGVGMPPPVLESIKKHFVSGETMAVFENTSVGVGMSLVAEMLRFTNGHIEIESELGVGTTVTFELPCAPVYYPWFPRSAKRIKTLHYGQTETVRDMVREFALFYNHEYQAISSLDDALDRADVDTLLIDVVTGNEIEWFAQQRDTGRLRNVVLLFISPRYRPPNASNVEMFPHPINPHHLRDYCIKLAQRKIKATDRPMGQNASRPTWLSYHILAVDDNAMNQLVIRQMLKKLGCTFELVSNGQEAVDTVIKAKFDLVLMDQFMPIMDGPTAARTIRKMEGEVSNIPIIAMTASNLYEDEVTCREAGMNGFICKPITLKNLAQVLEDVVHTSRPFMRSA